MRPQIVKIATILFITFFVTITSWSQQVPPPPERTPPPGLPIDSDLVYLILLGILLGLFFLFRTKRA